MLGHVPVLQIDIRFSIWVSVSKHILVNQMYLLLDATFMMLQNNRKDQGRRKELRAEYSHVCSFLRVTGDDPALVWVAFTLETNDRGAVCAEAYREEISSVQIVGRRPPTLSEIQVGAAACVLDRVDGVDPNLADEPKLDRRPDVIRLVLGEALDP